MLLFVALLNGASGSNLLRKFGDASVRKLLRAIIFFIGWTLSPFTLWNDAFINTPLSYLMANALYYITHLSFKWLVIGSYWVTNILGLFLMYSGGKNFVLSYRDKLKATLFLVTSVIIFSLIMMYLDRIGKLHPLGEFFGRYCIQK